LAPRGTTTTEFVDFSTGKQLTNYTGPDGNQVIQDIITFYNVLVNNGYDKMIEPGFWNLPNPPPADLTMSIGDFVKKYNCSGALPRMYESTGGGAGSRGNFLSLPTLTVLQSFPPSWIKVFFGAAPFYHIRGGNQALYTKIATLLGSDVMYNTVVIAADRSDSGVKLIVSGLSGTKVILAKKLLLAVPPTRENLIPFDQNAAEILLFSKPQYGRYHTAIVTHPKLPQGVELRNMPTSAVANPNSPFLDPPFVLSFSSFGNDSSLFSIGSSGSSYLLYPPEIAQLVAQNNLQTMANAGTIPNLQGKPLNVVQWSDHGPGGFGVSTADLNSGWMSQLYALQGKRSTWFTGNGVAIDFSTLLWKFNDDLITRMLASW
jgi:hypothetical protein